MKLASLNFTLIASVLAGLLAWPAQTHGQRFSGRVSSLTGDVLPGSHILLSHAGAPVAATVTDSSGSFSIAVSMLPVGHVVLRVRRIGYRMREDTMIVESDKKEYFINVRLERIALELSQIVVSAQRTERRLHREGFYDRAKDGFGHFVTEAQIQARNAHHVTDVLRAIPGLRFAPARGRPGYEVYMSRAQGRLTKLACPPKVFLDGIVTPPDFDTYLAPQELAAIEIYRGPAETPARFGGAESGCGVIVIWTK